MYVVIMSVGTGVSVQGAHMAWAGRAVIEWEGRQQPGRGDGGGDSSGWSSS